MSCVDFCGNLVTWSLGLPCTLYEDTTKSISPQPASFRLLVGINVSRTMTDSPQLCLPPLHSTMLPHIWPTWTASARLHWLVRDCNNKPRRDAASIPQHWPFSIDNVTTLYSTSKAAIPKPCISRICGIGVYRDGCLANASGLHAVEVPFAMDRVYFSTLIYEQKQNIDISFVQ